MSCDSSRKRLFGSFLSAQIQGDLGASVPAAELLEMIYDVAVSQTPPEDRAGQLVAAAGFSKMKARASIVGIDLFPHHTASGLPAPETVAAWAQVGALLDAIEGGKPFPSLAADVYQSLAFRTLTRLDAARTPWNPPMRWDSRAMMRGMWGADPAALELALAYPPAAAGDALDPLLTRLSTLLADDVMAPPDLAAAARQYLALAEAEALDDRERGAWARVLARASGLGIGGETGTGRGTCATCGKWASWGGGHHCHEGDQRLARALVLAALPLLADPERAPLEPSSDPLTLVDSLLDPLLAADGMVSHLPDPASPEAAMLEAARELDRLRVARLVSQDGFPKRVPDLDVRWLRDATRRAPVFFSGSPCIWEDGYLYKLDAFRQHADWSAPRGRMVADTTQAVCAIAAPDLLRAMSGGKFPLNKLQFSDVQKAALFGLQFKAAERIAVGDIVKFTCGCALACRSVEGARRRMERVVACAEPDHQTPTLTIAVDGARYMCVSLRSPHFSAPTWPQRKSLTAPRGPYGV